jgi:hypothetical protein
MARGQKAAPRSTWSEERKKKAQEYQYKNYSTVGASIPREAADRFRAYCKENGTTVSATLAAYIYSLIGRPGEDQKTGEASGDLDQIDRRGDDQSKNRETTGAGSIDQGGPATASQRDQIDRETGRPAADPPDRNDTHGTVDSHPGFDTPGPVDLPTANDTPGTVD